MQTIEAATETKTSGMMSARKLPACVGDTVISVLHDIRTLQANGLSYGSETNLSDAGFTSIEMVKVMLGVEAAFDLMIPQEHITPENFASASTISAMIRNLTGLA